MPRNIFEYPSALGYKTFFSTLESSFGSFLIEVAEFLVFLAFLLNEKTRDVMSIGIKTFW